MFLRPGKISRKTLILHVVIISPRNLEDVRGKIKANCLVSLPPAPVPNTYKTFDLTGLLHDCYLIPHVDFDPHVNYSPFKHIQIKT